jgi:hypothetical protein
VNEGHAVDAPAPSIWPVTLAVGVGLGAVGLITSPLVLAAGALTIAFALVGWIRQSLEEIP